MNRLSQTTVCSRRQFLSGCAACAGCFAGGTLLGPRVARANETAGNKPKIRVVFCETTNDKPIWPNIGYDFDMRRQQVLDALTQGCPDLQFLPTKVMDDAKHAAEVLQKDGEVDGYIVCVQGLGWRNDIVKWCATGKPTLLVDNLFGGSGLFLVKVIMHLAKTAGNNDSDMACRTKLQAVVKGDIEKLTENWRMGWHRVTFYGDLKEHVTELCDRLKLGLIEEA